MSCWAGFRTSAMAILLAALTACGSARRSEPIAGPLTNSDPVRRGAQVYSWHCQECHPAGETAIGPALNNKPLPDFLIRFQVRRGLGAMPSFSKEKLSDEDLDNLITYLKALRHNAPHP